MEKLMTALCSEIQTAYANFEETFGINIPEASRANRARLTAELGALTPEEQKLHDTLLSLPFTLRHGTAYGEAIRESGALLSVQERTRLGAVTRTHTGATGNRDDNVFFVLGAGREHRVPLFLGDETEIITAELTPELADSSGIFIAPHLSEFVGQKTLSPMIFSGTRKITSHVWHLDPDTLEETKEKTCRYVRPDGTAIERKYGLADEIFCGTDILPGLAAKLIRELRDIGLEYQKIIFEKLDDADFITDVYNAHFQSWAYPEAQVPVRFDLAANKATWSRSELHPKAEELHIAARTDDVAAIERLLAEGVPVNTPFKGALSPFIAAVIEQKDRAALYLLLQHGADPSLCKRNMFGGIYALPMAIRWDQHRVAGAILDKGRITDPKLPFIQHTIGDSLLEAIEDALRKKKKDFFDRIVLEYGDEINYKDSHLVSLACATGHRDLALFFTERGADVNRPYRGAMMADMYTPLMQLAVRTEKAEWAEGAALAEKLIGMGARVNDIYRKPIASLFGAKPGENNRSALWLAAEAGNLPMVEILVRHGALLDAANDLGETPRHAAERNGYKDVADFLAAKGAQSIPPQDAPVKKAGHATYTCAAVVTGTDANGERYVVMGRNRGKDTVLADYRFPGGGVDLCPDPLTAVLKEVYEETGINLRKLLPPEKLAQALLHHYEHVEEIENPMCRDGVSCNLRSHHTYIFDIGDAIDAVKMRAGDDFMQVRRVSLTDDIKADPAQVLAQRYKIDDIPVLGSNGLIAQMIADGKSGLSVTEAEEIQAALQLEYHGGQRLVSAFAARDMAVAQKLLAQGVPIDSVGSFNTSSICFSMTPLGVAVYYGDEEMMDFVLARNASINPQKVASTDGLLEVAILGEGKDKAGTVRRLLAAGACPEGYMALGTYNNRYRPLSKAIEHKEYDIVDALLAYGADVNRLDGGHEIDSDVCAIADAVSSGDARLVRSVLAYQPNLDVTWYSIYSDKTDKASILDLARAKGDTEIIELVAAAALHQTLAAKLETAPADFRLELQADDKGKPTIRATFNDKAKAEALGALTNASPRTDEATGEYFIRLGEIRMAHLFEDGARGRVIYKALAGTGTPDYGRVTQNLAAVAGPA